MPLNTLLPYREDMARDLMDLMRIPSVASAALPGAPFGQPCRDTLAHIAGMAARDGLTCSIIADSMVCVDYGEGEPYAAVVCHLDVVPAGEGWTYPPFAAHREGDVIYGRGASDNKSAAIVAYYCLKHLKSLNIRGRKLRVLLGTNEESGMDDIDNYLREQPLPVMAFSPDAGYPICNREMGIMRLRLLLPHEPSELLTLEAGQAYNSVPDLAVATVETDADLQPQLCDGPGSVEVERKGDIVKLTAHGKAAHGAAPASGVNAGIVLAQYLEKNLSLSLPILTLLTQGISPDGSAMRVDMRDGLSGALSMNAGILRYGGQGGEVGLDIRYPISANGDLIIDEITRQARKFGAQTVVRSNARPMYVPEDAPVMRCLAAAYEECTGEPCTNYSMAGGTYSRHFEGRCVAFGMHLPGMTAAGGHGPDERVSLEDMMRHGDICCEAMRRMAETELS